MCKSLIELIFTKYNQCKCIICSLHSRSHAILSGNPARTETFITWLFNVHKCLQTLNMEYNCLQWTFDVCEDSSKCEKRLCLAGLWSHCLPHGEIFRWAHCEYGISSHFHRDFIYSVPQKSEGTVHNFSNYWAPHFTERCNSTETHHITLLNVL